MAAKTSIRFSIGIALAAALIAVPADAQGRGKGKEKRNERQVQRASELRREAQRPELIRRGDAYEIRDRDDDRRRDRGNGGPPFCRNGQGHPVHGQRWCEEKGYGSYGIGTVFGAERRGDYGRYGSYEDAHAAFHRTHDRQCRARAAERPLDLQWQLRVRNECRDRHEEWHYRAGRAH